MAEGDQVRPAKPWATVADDGDGALKITIPVRRQWYHWLGIAVIGPALLMWFAANPVMLVGSPRGWPAIAPQPAQTYMPISLLVVVLGLWLVVWLGGSGWFLFNLLWWLSGREVVLIDSDTLTLRWEAPLYRFNKVYGLHEVGKLGGRGEPSGFYPSLWPWSAAIMYSPWHIAFEHCGKTIRFAGGIDEADAREIVARLLERFPSLGERA